MTTHRTEDGVTFTQEGERTRARTDTLNFLFPYSDPAMARDAYLRELPKVLAHFQSRWQGASTKAVPENAFLPFAQEVTLNAMYLYAINNQPIAITEGDLDHPQARRILRTHAGKCLKAGSKAELTFCAGVLGITVEALKGWIEGEKRMQEYR